MILCLATPAIPSVARADAVLDWNVQAQTTILAPAPTAHASTLSFALAHGAVHDAVNASPRSFTPCRTSCEQGAGIGRKVARWEHKHYFQRVE